jgi:hypothetical protein
VHVPFRERLWVWARNEPARAASLALLLLFFGAGGGFLLVHWLRLGAVGAPCQEPRDCRSERCVSVSGFQPMAVDPSAPEWEQKMARSMNDALDPLKERADGLGRFVSITESYCTRECASDSDCPSAFTCGEGKSYPSSLLGKGFVAGPSTPIRLCARR